MKKLLMGMMGALMLIGGATVAHADIEVVETDVCDITFTGSDDSHWEMSGEALSCIKSIASNRAWILERLQTQIHYYNKATEKLGNGHVGDNGAYWGDVMDARDTIDSLLRTIENQVEAAEVAQAALDAANTATNEANFFACNQLKELRRITEQSTGYQLWNVGNGMSGTCSAVGVDIDSGSTYYVQVVDEDGNPR